MLAAGRARGAGRLGGAVRALSSEEAPALTQVYGGLKDTDRIFTNLYGE